MSRKTAVLSALLSGFAVLPVMTQLALAQSNIQWADNPNSPPSSPPPIESRGSGYAASVISQQELESLVAPIALFPDSMLAQVLMAATYPDDVHDAAGWISSPYNARLTGFALSDAVDGMDWDPSIKALTAAPEVLRMMDRRADWTDRLGQAFTADQGRVMDAVQRLRREARDTGHLRSDRTRRVIDENGAIIIEPASPQEMYVQFYDPRDVYGPWAYADYPPVYFPPSLYATLYPVALGTPLWGWSSWDWRGRSLHLDVTRWRALNHDRSHIVVGNTWQHDFHRDSGPREGGRDGGRDQGRIGQGPRNANRANFDTRRDGNDARTPSNAAIPANPRANGQMNGNADRGGRDRRRDNAPSASAAPSAPAQTTQPQGRFQDRQGVGQGIGRPTRDFANRAREENREEYTTRAPAAAPNTPASPRQDDQRRRNEGGFSSRQFGQSPTAQAASNNPGPNNPGMGAGGWQSQRGRQPVPPPAPAVAHPQPQPAPEGNDRGRHSQPDGPAH